MDHMEAQTQMVDELVMHVSQVPIFGPSQGTSGTASNVEGRKYFTLSASKGSPCSTQGAVTTANRHKLGTKATEGLFLNQTLKVGLFSGEDLPGKYEVDYRS